MSKFVKAGSASGRRRFLDIASGITFVDRVFTVATLPPAASNTGSVIFVSDGATGKPCLAFSDGTNWKIIANITDAPIASGNFIPNSTLVGVVPATDTPPNGWTIDKPTGISVDIVAAGLVEGIPSMDVRFSGTAGANGNCQINFTGGTQVPAANGDQWGLGYHCQLVAGSFANTGVKQGYIMELGAGGSFLNGTFLDHNFGTSGDSFVQRWNQLGRLFNQASVQFARFGCYVTLANGAVVDFTLRVGQPLARKEPWDLVAWGDSLTQGQGQDPWPSQLGRLLQTKKLISNAGVGGETSTQVKTRLLASPAWLLKATSVIWVGRNNPTQGTTIKTDIAEMVDALAHTRFFVIPWMPSAQEPKNSPTWIENRAHAGELAELYGPNCLDLYPVLLESGTGVGQDLIDKNNGVIPTSLRIDDTHLTSAGYAIVAARIRDIVVARGW